MKQKKRKNAKKSFSSFFLLSSSMSCLCSHSYTYLPFRSLISPPTPYAYKTYFNFTLLFPFRDSSTPRRVCVSRIIC